jgi:hypothetical protein
MDDLPGRRFLFFQCLASSDHSTWVISRILENNSHPTAILYLGNLLINADKFVFDFVI